MPDIRNRISVEVPQQLVDTTRMLLQQITNSMPFLIGLDANERESMPKINVVNNVFVTDVLNAARENNAILPSYIDLAEPEKDKGSYDLLDEIVLMTETLASKLRDTQMLMGSEAYRMALLIYRLFESAAKAGVPGADAVYSRLSERFMNQGGGGPTPPTV